MTGKFDADQPSGELLKNCWIDIHNQRGARAQLCRAKSVDDIILLPVFQRACLRFRPFFQQEDHWEYRLAAVIGLLAHLGETEFAAGLFYLYLCIDKELLIGNLSGNKDLADKTLGALIESAATVSPTGKQNSFASRAHPSSCARPATSNRAPCPSPS